MLDSARGFLLGLADSLNVRFDPFDEFTRPADINDTRPLSEKADDWDRDLRARFLFGHNGEFYANQWPNDLGDNAIWQGVWLFHECLKGHGGQIDRALTGLERMVYSSPKARLARGVDRWPDRVSVVDPSRTYFQRGDYVWTQQVSESSLLGLVFGCWAVMHLDPGPAFSSRAKRLIATMATTLINDGYRLLDDDDRPAKYGDLRPSHLTAPIRLVALGATLLLASWSDSHRKEEYLKRYHDLVGKHMGSMLHPETHFLWIHPWYQDFLVYISLPVLIRFETNLVRRDEWKNALWRQWQKNRKEGNPFYTYMTHHMSKNVSTRDLARARQILEEFSPLAKVKGRKATTVDYGTFRWGPKFLRGGKLYAKQPVAPWARPAADFFWQRDPYAIEGYADHDYNMLDYLVGYRMMRRWA